VIPYGRQSIKKEDIHAVIKVLHSGWLTQGTKIIEFEKNLARYCRVRYGVAVSHGTSALHLAYLAAGIGKGDEVITTPNTFAATANMIIAVGAQPVFCDIRLDTYNIDEKKIESLITKRTKMIVSVDFAGHPVEYKEFKRIAKKHKLTFISDSCQSLGARYHTKRIGSLAEMSVFSFHPVKSITTGEGGAIVTNDRVLYKKLVSLRTHGIHKDKKGKNVMTELGYNYRLSNIHAALGVSQLKQLNSFIKKRHNVVKWYIKELRGMNDIVLPQEKNNVYSAWHIYVIRTRDVTSRNLLMKYLKDKGIGVNFHFPAVYSHPYYRKHGYKKVSLPNMEVYHQTCITLPLYPDLKKDEVRYITQTIKKFFKTA